jgi:fibronectin type 3 domain-containing protein
MPGKLYAYSLKVSGESGTGDSDASAANTGWRGLAAPVGVSASDGTSSSAVVVNWMGSPGAASYRILRSSGGGAMALVGTVSAHTITYTDTSATPGVAYAYAVQAVGEPGTGSSEPSLPDNGWRAAPAPTGVTASDGTSTSAVLVAWNAVPGATGYKVFRATSSTAPALLASVTTTSYTDASALPGVQYSYSVKAFGVGGTGDGPASLPDAGWRNMLAPAAVAASDGTSLDGIGVTWSASDGAASYKVFRAAGVAAPVQVGSTSALVLAFTDVTAVPGVLYRYTVKASGGLGTGDSAATDGDTGWRMLQAPRALSATDGTSTMQVTLTWSASPGASLYRVYRSDRPDAIGTSASATYADTSAVPGVTYTYWVKAAGATGTGDSAASSTDTGWRGVPAPTGVAASDGTNTSGVLVTWTAVPGVSSYRVMRGAPGSPLSALATCSTTAYLDTATSVGVRYAYAVQAVTAAGTGLLSASDTGWRNLPAPTGFLASDTITTRIALTWNAVADASGYYVYRGTSAAVLVRINGGAPVSGTSFDDTTATAGVTYFYAVTARSLAGESARSTVDSGIRPSSLGGPSGFGWQGGSGASGGDQGPANTGGADDPMLAPMGVERYLLTIAVVADAPVSCDATAGDVANATEPAAGATVTDAPNADAPDAILPTDGVLPTPSDALPASTDASENGVEGGPTFIDLDGNGEPDLCQLRHGDLDLNGSIDAGDMAVLMGMMGEQALLGIGDLDGDGVIGAGDLAALATLIPTSAPAAP